MLFITKGQFGCPSQNPTLIRERGTAGHRNNSLTDYTEAFLPSSVYKMYLALPATQAQFTLVATKLKKPSQLRFHSPATSAQKYSKTFPLICYWCSYTHVLFHFAA